MIIFFFYISRTWNEQKALELFYTQFFNGTKETSLIEQGESRTHFRGHRGKHRANVHCAYIQVSGCRTVEYNQHTKAMVLLHIGGLIVFICLPSLGWVDACDGTY